MGSHAIFWIQQQYSKITKCLDVDIFVIHSQLNLYAGIDIIVCHMRNSIFQTSVEICTLLLPTRESFEKHDNIIYCSMTNIQMKLGHESHVNVCNSLVAHVYDKYQLLQREKQAITQHRLFIQQQPEHRNVGCETENTYPDELL